MRRSDTFALVASKATYLCRLQTSFKSLRGETPSYVAYDCELIADSGRRRLRSAVANALTVPRTDTRLGDRSFSVAGLKIWNSLPVTLRTLNLCSSNDF